METTATAAGQERQAGRSLRDYAQLRAQVAACLEDLALINEQIGQPARAARARESRDSLLAQRFTLLVLGEFKRGKSTLINRLLGVEALPVGAAPTTAVLTRVTYGEEPSARIVLEDGTERLVPFERLAEEITLAQDDEGTNRRRHAGIARAELALPAALCRDGVDLVDSPGLGEHSTRTEVTYEALPAADAVIFVSDAAQLGNEDEGFVRGRLANEAIDNVFFAINKWDRVYNEAEDPETEILALRRRAWSLFVPEPKVGYNGQDLRANRIYPISCRPNLAPEEERAALDALFDAFRADLEAFLVREAGRVAMDRAVARARAQVAETQAGLRARGPALAADLAEFERRVAAAEAALGKLEAPREAIRNAIAAKRQEINTEVKARTDRVLPGLEKSIEDAWAAREYRPKGPLGQRILDGMQDSFRRQKIREEMRLQLREIAAAQLEPWANGLNGYVEAEIKTLLQQVEAEAGRIDATLQEASRIVSGLDQPIDSSERDQQDLLQRGLAAGVGVLMGNPYLIMVGGMHGFKGVGRAMLYQLGLGTAGLLLVAIGLPALPVLVTASAAGATIAAVQGNDDLIEGLKRQTLDDLLERLRAMRTTGLAELQTRTVAPLDACGVAIEQAIEGRIRDHREGVVALRTQFGLAREDGVREQSRLEATQEAVSGIAARLEALA